MNKTELKLVRAALLAVETAEVEAMKKFPATNASHSEGYEEKISELLSGSLNGERHSARRIPLVAAIAAAVLISLTVTAVAFGDKISNFFEEVFDKYTRLEVNDTETDLLDEIHIPTYLPEGYEQNEYSEGLTYVDATWDNGTNLIMYSQSALNAGSVTMDTESAEHSYVNVCGFNMHCVTKNDTYLLVWEDGSYCYVMQCPVTLDWEEIERIVDSIS